MQLVKPGRRQVLAPKASGRRGGGSWIHRVHQIGKSSRSITVERPIKHDPLVSLGLWPKDTTWGGQNPMTHSLESVDSVWFESFRTSTLPVIMQKWRQKDTVQVMRYYLDLPSGRDDTNEQFVGLQADDTARLFRNVMLFCLKYRKKQALMLLLATYKGRKFRPPRYMIADSLNSLARHFLFRVPHPNPIAVDAIFFLTCKFIEGASDQEQEFVVDQQLIYNLVQSIDDSRVLSLYWLLSANKAVLHAHTMLHFLDRFVEVGKFKLAMELLGTIVKTGIDLSFEQILMACTKLLRARADAGSEFKREMEYTVRSNILTQILKMGVRPNIPVFNTILLNAGEGGDFDSAWHMYNLLVAKESALKPDAITFCVLLKGAKLSDDSSNIEMVIREIQKNGKALENLRVINDVLHAISLISPGDEFGAMLDFYKQHCDLRPLQEISLLGDEIQAPSGEESQGLWPSRMILGQMMVAYIKLHQGSPSLIHTYERYYQGVKENHPVIAPLAERDAVANAFIMAFGTEPDTLQHCTAVVKHMLEFSSPKFATSYNVAHTAPTVKTWSILIAAFFSRGQRRAAEKVLDTMRKRGVECNEVTWNILIKGYASSQDVNAVADTVKRREAAGFEYDDYTAKALGILWRQDLLISALDRNKEEPPLENENMTSKLTLPSLSSEWEYEAYTNLQWESGTSNPESQARRYWEAKCQEQLGIEFEKPSESLDETVMGVLDEPLTNL